MGLLRHKEGSDEPGLTLYYASDVHGSEQCWRKFLGAARFYNATALVMGGDLTGKALVPVTHINSHYEATFLGNRHEVSEGAELDKLLEAIRFHGMYPLVASASEIERLRDDAGARDAAFDETMIAELRRWIELADERMSERGVEVFVMPGNDDPWSCDAILESASYVQACDHRIVRVGPYEMLSCAHANLTPWDSPRELDEEDLYCHLKELAEQLEAPERAIFNLHVPPHDTGLDRAVEINDDLTPVIRAGQPVEAAVGSTAVRQIIEEYQPLLSLHGHIHESRNSAKLGRTLALNSGSEYNSGRLHGVIIELAGAGVVSHQFTIG